MTKRICLTSEFYLNKKCDKTANKDRISELPDGILLSILSRLKIKEAARTSVFSHRWENLWTCISNLDFDASEIRERLHDENATWWVNQALNSHQAPNLEGFRICLDVTQTPAVDIDTWINFATKKRVQRLELDFSRPHDNYEYQFQQRYGITAENVCFGSCFKSLTTLCLKQVDLSQELFDDVLSNSPFLEHLRVHNCRTLVSLRVSSPSSILNYLEISSCSHLKSIEISAMYLKSFKYTGRKATILFKEAPQLIEVLFQVRGDYSVMDMSRQLSRYLWQLRKIVWTLNHECYLRLIHPEFPKLPTLRNLRHLELQVWAPNGIKNHAIMSFLEASPFIHTFKLELELLYSNHKIVPTRCVPTAITKKRPHLFLKIVELIGFVGTTPEQAIALYLLENAVSLEKLIISPSDFQSSSMASEIKEKQKCLTRRYAIKLARKLPPGVEFQML